MQLFPYVTRKYLQIVLVAVSLYVSACGNGQPQPLAAASVDSSTHASTVTPAAPPAGFKHQTANINGINLHYVIGGTGEPLLLIHGFGQNWYMWNRLLPEFSKYFTVIA